MINNQKTIEKMKQMHFHGMWKAFQSTMDTEKSEPYTPDELVSYIVEAEWDDRQTRKTERSIRNAHFRYKSLAEEIHFDKSRNLDKNAFLRFASCEFILKKENIIITGSTGVGKSFVSSAIGHQACLKGLKVMYFNTSKLFSKLKLMKADGSYLKEINRIEKQDLIILDDFGIQPFDSQNRLALMEIIEDRHGKASTIITSQIPVTKWFEIIGEKTIADAILDRIAHSSHRIDLKGESMRKLTLKKSNDENQD